jgi:hypothetical protein
MKTTIDFMPGLVRYVSAILKKKKKTSKKPKFREG